MLQSKSGKECKGLVYNIVKFNSKTVTNFEQTLEALYLSDLYLLNVWYKNIIAYSGILFPFYIINCYN